MAPLAHAMRLIDRDQRDRGSLEHSAESRLSGAFRGYIEKREFTAQKRCDSLLLFSVILPAVKRGRANTEPDESADLVVHQCDQRRDHEGRAVTSPVLCDRGDLIAERLARTGREQHDRVAASERRLDRLGLSGAEVGVAEDLREQIVRVLSFRGSGHVQCLPRPVVTRAGQRTLTSTTRFPDASLT